MTAHKMTFDTFRYHKAFLLGLIFIALSWSTCCFAQDYRDVVFLKNGSVIKGFYKELYPGDSLRSGGDETSWSDYGRACQILDNLIAAGSIRPMIVVMPNGNIELDAAPGESPYMDKLPSGNNVTSMLGKFEMLFMKEIVGYTERHYRVKADKAHRAIAGLSMGGLHALYISLNNPDAFDYVGLFSAQTSNMLNENRLFKVERFNYNLQRAKNVFALIGDHVAKPVTLSDKTSCIGIYRDLEKKLARQFQNPPSLYYIAIGKDDFLMKMNTEYRQLLDAHGYNYVYMLTYGAHSWKNWRKYLVDFLMKMQEGRREA